jgi:hypothetical protein
VVEVVVPVEEGACVAAVDVEVGAWVVVAVEVGTDEDVVDVVCACCEVTFVTLLV